MEQSYVGAKFRGAKFQPPGAKFRGAKFRSPREDIKKGKERPRDPPTVWPNNPDVVPPSQRPTLPPKPRPTSRTSLVLRGTQPCEMTLFRERDVVNFEDIQTRVSSETDRFCCQVTSYERGRKVIIQSTTTSNGVPTVVRRWPANS